MAAKPYVKGFYWGADGYVWGIDFQHADHGHKTWKYDFERHLYQFQLWGRLSFDPNTDDGTFHWLQSDTYGPLHTGEFLLGLKHASAIIPAVNRLFWLNYDMQWHPESCLSHPRHGGFKTINDFVHASPMPGAGVAGIREFARAEHSGEREALAALYDETPEDIILKLKQAAAETKAAADKLAESLGVHLAGHLACTLYDLYAYAELG
ncbi:hypothetical protein K0U00_44675, partial [Paenibacillus sepulcri]|nr:hypothetical protein [Paenibacillus sepulcri]